MPIRGDMQKHPTWICGRQKNIWSGETWGAWSHHHRSNTKLLHDRLKDRRMETDDHVPRNQLVVLGRYRWVAHCWTRRIAYRILCRYFINCHSSRHSLIVERRLVIDLIQFVVVLIVVGVLLWLVNNYIPMDYKIKQILNIVVVIAVILWVLNVFGMLSSLRGIQVGK
jgi:hypothetical protein